MVFAQPKTILIIGRRGRGKSSLCNLLREGARWSEEFPVSHLENSIAIRPQTKESRIYPNLLIQDTTGWDMSLPQSAIVDEIQQLIFSQRSIHGVLFVIQAGRADDWDKMVFVAYLQFIMAGVPESMIGVVFSHAHDDCVFSNSLETYRQTSADFHTDQNFQFFFDELMRRCGRKVCFVDNSPPSKDKINRDPLRQKSLENVMTLIKLLDGSFSFDGVKDLFVTKFKYWYTYGRENPFKVGVAVISTVGTILSAIAGVRR